MPGGADRNRPQDMGGPGEHQERTGTQAPDPIDPMVVGQRVLNAVRADAPYIVTHKEQKAMVEGRFGPVLGAFDRL